MKMQDHNRHKYLSALFGLKKRKREQRVKSQEVGGDVAMDRMKKILSSPITKKRALSTTKYFGVPLEDIVKREGTTVPFLVQKICNYILSHGIYCEGIFRVNGNSRLVERLRTSFDRTGDADLEDAGDVMAVAGLLKLYLRELPEGVIPDHMTQLFVTTQIECMSDMAQCLSRLRELLVRLPKPSFDLLKFLMRFLVQVSQHEDQNKMSPVALGIVFGPNLFSERSLNSSRCSGGIEGLRQQGVTNQIVLHFISQYDSLFLEAGDVSPYSATTTQVIELSKNKAPPPRPPPPQTDGSSSPPIPSPRKIRSRVTVLQESEDVEGGSDDSRGNTPRSALTPRLSDDEQLDTYRSASPFVLDSDRSESSAIASPMTSLSMEVVEKAISHAVSRHMFGESSDDDTTSDAPIPAPRKKRRERGIDVGSEEEHTSATPSSSESPEGTHNSIRSRIRKFETDEDGMNGGRSHALVGDGGNNKTVKTRPKSKAFELFESQGIVITPAPDSMSRHLQAGSSRPVEVPVEGSDGEEDEEEEEEEEEEQSRKVQQQQQSPLQGLRPQPRPRTLTKRKDLKGEDGVNTSEDSLANLDSDDSGFSSIQRNSSTLTMFKRAPGPRNRRTPSRRSLRMSPTSERGVGGSLEDGEEEAELGDDDSRAMEQEEGLTGGRNSTSPVKHASSDEPQRSAPPRTLHNGSGTGNHQDPASGDVNGSHTGPPRPSINFLNIHISSGNGSWSGNGSNGARDERSSPDRSPTSQRKPYVPPLDLSILHEHGDGSDPIPADQGPSMAIHKAKSLKDEDAIMLSPRTSKLKKKMGRPEDDHTIQVKQLTRKIQSCKRKIKVFEESFEEERGYRPSQTDKAANPEVKKTMQELARARKEFRRLKEEIENYEHFVGEPTMGSGELRPVIRDAFTEEPGIAHTAPTPPAGGGRGEYPPRMEDTLEVLLHRLAEKRRDASRPEDLSLMLREQVVEEKLAVQKSLLQYENLHGRPTSKYEKELMKPLYDRYRQIKRILAKPASPRDRTKILESVPEDHLVDFSASPSSSSTKTSTNRDVVRIPTAIVDTEPDTGSGDRDFLVTRDLGLLRETLKSSSNHSPPAVGAGAQQQDLSPEGGLGWNTDESPLHELSIKELLEEQQKARQEKKRLRRVLREFEDDFLRQSGRKVQKDDRAPMDTEYYEYKQVKARLKLLEALLSKHDRI